MKIGIPINKNYRKANDVLNSLRCFTSMGYEYLQLANSIGEAEDEETGEKYAIFDFETQMGTVYMLVHDKIVIDFISTEK